MRIESSMVGMESVRTYSRKETTKFELGAYLPDAEGESEEPIKAIKVINVEPERGVSLGSRLRESCLEYLWQCLFGESYKDRFREELCQEEGCKDYLSYLGMAGGAGGGSRQFFTMEQYVSEEEYTTFSTQGTVRCADGRELSFDLSAVMSRKVESYVKVSGTAQIRQMIDPLVINLDGNVASVSDMTFFFDLDADGQEEEISMLGSGSGYLALDKSGDGIINDGSELFGTASGDGFKDLASYDRDGNGWIDENDAIFDKLKIWSMDEDGNQVLYSLKEAGVGAVYLGSASTEFTLGATATAFTPAAQIRSTGLFLYENGMAGTIQHVDMAAYN